MNCCKNALQADGPGQNMVWLRVTPVDDQRAVADHTDAIALGQDLELIPVVLQPDLHSQALCEDRGEDCGED